MIETLKTLTRSKFQPRGFALVVTVSLMVLLAVMCVGLLGLSAVSLRSSSQTQAQAEAQANARLALMIAIGELQEQLGPDQRISADGGLLDDPETTDNEVRNPHWTGVWDSWIAGDLVKAPVNPAYPSAASHHQTIGSQPDGSMRPEYAKKDDHFRAWLLSLNPDEVADVASARTLALNGETMPSPDAEAVRLLGQGTLGRDAPVTDYINARLLPVESASASSLRGRYGWWVGDESQKATIMDDAYQTRRPADLADRLNRQQAPASLGNSEIEGLENVAEQASFSFMPSLNTLGLVKGVAAARVTGQFHDITTRSLGVLADVREGGLKRDLSTILERPIDPDEVYNFKNVEEFRRAISVKPGGNDFMLYNFDTMVNSMSRTGEAAVPIQDLAAYYQLYDRYRPGSMGGIQYSSRESSPPHGNLNNGIMVSNPNIGETPNDIDQYLRQYTSLYRSPVPVKIEIILSYITEPRSPAEINNDKANGITNPDPYKLRVGLSPAMTFWNPNNVPLVMNIGDPDRASIMIRETAIPLKVTFKKSNSSTGAAVEQTELQFTRITGTQQGELYTLFVSGNYPTVFEPGESKVFALRFASNTNSNSASNYADFYLRGSGYRYSEPFVAELELVPGWNPEKFIRPKRGGNVGGSANVKVENIFNFKEGDYISASVEAGNYNDFTVDFAQKSRHGRNAPGVKWHFRSFKIGSRMGADATYRNDFVYQGFPNSGNAISNSSPRTIDVPARSAQTLIDAMGSRFNPRDDLPQAFFYYGIKAAVETHESNNMAPILGGAGRRFPTRPFTHSTAMAPVFLDSTNPGSLYNYGWNWFFMPLDNVLDAPVEISRGNSGYYGGGYTAENGATHVIQQQLPVTPPISIATLSHAHLGGFSLATEAPAAGYEGLRNPIDTEAFRRTTALGFDGFAPHTLQAIGNSYAHPNIPAGKAVTTWTRRFARNTTTREPFADHSYLANKALWDEFFFSSISPRPAQAKVFSRGMTAEQVARDFFFNEKPLPNPRIVPYEPGLDPVRLSELFAGYDDFKDGFADKIAAHLMVEGPFNVNSTSVTAWKALFASLKKQQVSYLDADSALVVGTNLDYESIDGVPVPGGPMPNGKAYKGSSSDPSDREQWSGFRELTDTEIDELATAMVRQVKLRGPFLSLSDFVNRRLDPGNAKGMALMGALQAALDDPEVSINAGFRKAPREFTNREVSFMRTDAEFSAALEGPVAYGSAAYVDQADILRSFPAQLTPRGDTFVIRAYGDSIDGQGMVAARAWCEAVVQRLPEYADPDDEPELRQQDLESQVNRTYGRKLAIVQFRWLNPSEI